MKLIALIFALVACSSNRTMIDTIFPTPPQYQQWHQELEKCSGLTQRFSSIKFFIGDSLQVSGEEYDGLWVPKGNIIILRRDRMLDKCSVMHEMMHSLTQSPVHSFKYFSLVCGQLIPTERRGCSLIS